MPSLAEELRALFKNERNFDGITPVGQRPLQDILADVERLEDRVDSYMVLLEQGELRKAHMRWERLKKWIDASQLGDTWYRSLLLEVMVQLEKEGAQDAV